MIDNEVDKIKFSSLSLPPFNDNDNDAAKCACALLSSTKNPKSLKPSKNEDFTRGVPLLDSPILYYTVLHTYIHTYKRVLRALLGYYSFPHCHAVLLKGDSLSCQ